MPELLQARLFNITDTLPVNEASGMLAPRTGFLYEIRHIRSHWARDAAWTEDTAFSFRNTYGIMPRTAAANNALIGMHEAGFHSQTAAGVEWQPKAFHDWTDYPPGLLIPGLLVDRNSLGTGAVSLRWDWTVHFAIHQVSRSDYLANLKVWGVDTDADIVPVRYGNFQF